MFKYYHLARRLQTPLKEEEDAYSADVPGGYKTLQLGVVHPGPFVPWGIVEDQIKDPLWVVNMSPSRVEMETGGVDFDHDHKDVEEEEEEIKKIESYKGLGRRSTVKDPTDADLEQLRRQSSEDDPNAFIMQMKKDIHLQRHIRRLLLLAHKKALAEWAKTPFKLTGQEGRGEAEVLKLLFLVADQPLEDDRMTADQVEELKGQTPYGEFPTISKCGLTFGDASAISMALATKFQLYGETVQEQLVVGATYSRLRQLEEKHKRNLAWVMSGQVKDKAKHEWAQSQLLHVILPPAIKEWDQQIRSTKGPFLVESGMTLADVAIMNFLDQCSSHVMIDGLLADHLAVSDLVEAVRSCPRLLAHLQDREED